MACKGCAQRRAAIKRMVRRATQPAKPKQTTPQPPKPNDKIVF